MFTVIASPRARHQVEHQKALAEGLQRYGMKPFLSHSETHVPTELVACWGWRIGQRLRDAGHRVLVMERGYLGDRFSYASLAWNGLNGHAQFPVYDYDDSRFKALNITMAPWKEKGDYALILGQVPQDASLKGLDLIPWYYRVTQEVWEKHRLPCMFRQHPDLDKCGQSQSITTAQRSTGSLQDALAGAAFSICFNSNSSVDSVLSGVPCIVADRGAMAWEVCGHEIGEVIRPDRENWVHELAWKQWTIGEIKSGESLKGIVDMI